MKPTFTPPFLISQTSIILIPVIVLAFCVASPKAYAIEKTPPPEQIEPLKESPAPTFSLTNCYELSLKRSETIAIRKEEIEETEAVFLKAAGEIFGDVDFTITDFRQDAPENASAGSSSVERTSSAYDRRERKFVISQPLFQGFRSIAALGGAGSLRKQRKEEQIRAEQLLFLDVARSFYTVFKYERDVNLIKEILQSYEERVLELKEREKIGRSRASEVVTTISRMKILESELANSRGLFAIAQHALEFLTGTTIEASQLEDGPLPNEADLELAEYLKSSEMRPDVQAAKQAMKTAWRAVIEAQSTIWPEISLESNRYIKREGFQKDINWDVLFKINIPLSRGGENLGNLKQAISRWKKSKLNYSLTKRQAELNIKESYQTWRASSEEFKALEEAAKASKNNLDIQKEEYAHNLVSNLDVLEALQEFHETRKQANEKYYQMKENFWQLKVAVGDML